MWRGGGKISTILCYYVWMRVKQQKEQNWTQRRLELTKRKTEIELTKSHVKSRKTSFV